MRKLLSLSCAVLALLIVSAIASPADARRGHGAHSRGHHHFGGRSFHSAPRFRSAPSFRHRGFSGHRHSGHWRRYNRHRGIYIGAPFIYGYSYYGSCNWLRRKALRTGSSYWWNRYYDCIYDY